MVDRLAGLSCEQCNASVVEHALTQYFEMVDAQ